MRHPSSTPESSTGRASATRNRVALTYATSAPRTSKLRVLSVICAFRSFPPGPAWNAGWRVGTKRSLKPRQIWAIRFILDREHRLRPASRSNGI